MAHKIITLDDHVNGIIKAKGPDGALTSRYHYRELEGILREVHERSKDLRDLRAYHFYGVAGKWKLRNGKNNYELAKEATCELIAVLRKRHGWSYEQVVQNIRLEHFTKEKVKYGATLGGMIQKVYSSSPSRAVMDYLKTHPNKRVRNKFKDLETYHFNHCQNNSWILKNRRRNLKLARQATGELVDVLRKKHGWSYEQVVQNIEHKHFAEEKIKYGANLGGMIASVYCSSPSRAMMDYLKMHPSESVRRRFKDLKAYHFGKQLNIWNKKDGKKNYKLAREATGELVEILRRRYRWSYTDIVRKIRKEHFENVRIEYGVTLFGMIGRVYNSSPSKAIMDYLQHHPDEEVKAQFKDLKVYHFSTGQQNMWNKKDGKKNYKLAREATGELVDVLKRRYRWTDMQIIRNIKVKHFCEEKIGYGASVGRVLYGVYEGSVKDAVWDYFRYRRAA